MDFFILDCPPRHDSKIPLGTTDAFPGCIIVNCPVCGVRGIRDDAKTRNLAVEIAVQDVGYLDDLEQASTRFLWSRRARDAAIGARLTGIEFYSPVGYKIQTKKKGAQRIVEDCERVFEYMVMQVTGRGGSLERTCGMKLRSKCDACGWEDWSPPRNGIIVDEDQWDGSDFFDVDGFSWLMSERAVEALNDSGLSNFGAKPARDHHPIWR